MLCSAMLALSPYLLLCCTVSVISHRLPFLPAALMQGCGGCHSHISHNAALLRGLTFSVRAFPTSQEKIRSLYPLIALTVFCFTCLATSQMCAALLHQLSIGRRLEPGCTL